MENVAVWFVIGSFSLCGVFPPHVEHIHEYVPKRWHPEGEFDWFTINEMDLYPNNIVCKQHHKKGHFALWEVIVLMHGRTYQYPDLCSIYL